MSVRLSSPAHPAFPFPAIRHWTRSLISFRVECSSSSSSYYVPFSCCRPSRFSLPCLGRFPLCDQLLLRRIPIYDAKLHHWSIAISMDSIPRYKYFQRFFFFFRISCRRRLNISIQNSLYVNFYYQNFWVRSFAILYAETFVIECKYIFIRMICIIYIVIFL